MDEDPAVTAEANDGSREYVRRLLPTRGALFLCAHNAARSPMAEALGRRRARGSSILVESAGIEPAQSVHPFAVETMRVEDQIDISGHVPRSVTSLSAEDWSRFDLVISLVPREVLTSHRAFASTGLPSIETLYWKTEDPTLANGDVRRDVLLDRFRDVHDQLKRRISQLARRGHESFGPPGMR